MELNEAKELVYEEYIKNKYKEMWEDPEKSGDEILSLFVLSHDVFALAKKMEHIRDGNPTHFLKEDNPSNEEFKKFSEIAELCLIVTEIAEALEEVLAGNRSKADIEYIDIIIRAWNGMSRNSKGNFEEILKKKHLKNMSREALHGRKV